MIDAYKIFRDRVCVKWWDIHNYCQANWTHQGLSEFVGQQRPAFIDATTDPFTETELVSVVTKNNLHKLAPILVADLELAQRHRHLNFLFYPLWLLSAIEKHSEQSNQLNQLRQTRLSCLNRLPRLHRFFTYYVLSQQSWFDQVLISFAGLDCDLGARADVATLDELYVLGTDIRNYFVDHATDFPRSSQVNYDWSNCHDAANPAYTDCWANLATETSVHAFCVTEKTTKALRSGCLFFPVASAGFMQQLSSMGFDVDFQGIDYGFDLDQHWKTRVTGCVKEINRIYQDLPDIWQHNRQRLQHNSELFGSQRLLSYCLQDVENYV